LLVVHRGERLIYLPPSLCHEASLPTDFIKDRKKAKRLHDYKITEPSERFKRITSIVNHIDENKDSSFEQWNMKINQQFA